MKLAIVVAAAAVAAAPALACDDQPPAVNLVATPSVKTGLAAAYAGAHPDRRSARPVPGRTWYGRFGGYEFAVATFGAHPSVFSRQPRGRWRLDRDTRGAVCGGLVPVQLLAVTWSFAYSQRNCWVEPR
jgi:opacity protein-like surface antigen